MKYWQIVSDNDSSFVQTSAQNVGPRYRVEIVCEATGARELAGQFIALNEADELAEWFGKAGPVRAEVSRIRSAA